MSANIICAYSRKSAMNDMQNSELLRLNSFDQDERMSVLEKLCEDNSVFPDETANVNMHCHSFFSYNPFGWSPARIAWEAKSAGLYAAGLCDFDVLEGLNEFLRAGEMLKLRTAVHLETRVFVHEFADKEITSPGEPGVTYIMGAGFSKIDPGFQYRITALPSRHGLIIDHSRQRIRNNIGRHTACYACQVGHRIPGLSMINFIGQEWMSTVMSPGKVMPAAGAQVGGEQYGSMHFPWN